MVVRGTETGLMLPILAHASKIVWNFLGQGDAAYFLKNETEILDETSCLEKWTMGNVRNIAETGVNTPTLEIFPLNSF
jgi:hypothetical protein